MHAAVNTLVFIPTKLVGVELIGDLFDFGFGQFGSYRMFDE